MRVIATAGHVDHGKSTLIHALTGTHPDRLAEERRRDRAHRPRERPHPVRRGQRRGSFQPWHLGPDRPERPRLCSDPCRHRQPRAATSPGDTAVRSRTRPRPEHVGRPDRPVRPGRTRPRCRLPPSLAARHHRHRTPHPPRLRLRRPRRRRPRLALPHRPLDKPASKKKTARLQRHAREYHVHDGTMVTAAAGPSRTSLLPAAVYGVVPSSSVSVVVTAQGTPRRRPSGAPRRRPGGAYREG